MGLIKNLTPWFSSTFHMQLVEPRAHARRHVDACSQSPSPPPPICVFTIWSTNNSEWLKVVLQWKRREAASGTWEWGGGGILTTPDTPTRAPMGWVGRRSSHSLGPPSPSSIPFFTPVSLYPSSLPLLHHPGSRLHSLSIIPPVVCHRIQNSPSLRSSDPRVAERARRRRSTPYTQQLCVSPGHLLAGAHLQPRDEACYLCLIPLCIT